MGRRNDIIAIVPGYPVKKPVSHIARILFEGYAGSAFDPEIVAAHMDIHTVPFSHGAHEFLVPVRILAAHPVIEVKNSRFNSHLIAQNGNHMEEEHGIFPGGQRKQQPVTPGEKAMLSYKTLYPCDYRIHAIKISPCVYGVY
jgi:hypothetical protein